KAAWSPLATAAISHTSSAGVSIQVHPERWNDGRDAPRLQPGGRSVAQAPSGPARSGRGLPVNTDQSAEGLRSDPGSDPHRADAVGSGLLGHIVGGALTRLVALVEQLDLFQLLERFRKRKPRLLELGLQLIRRALEIVAPGHRCLGVGRISEMRRIMDAGAI